MKDTTLVVQGPGSRLVSPGASDGKLQTCHHRWVLSSVILRPLTLQEIDRPAQFVQAVHPVLDGDPSAITDVRQDAKDGIVIVEALARLAVPQLVGVTKAAVGLTQVV